MPEIFLFFILTDFLTGIAFHQIYGFSILHFEVVPIFIIYLFFNSFMYICNCPSQYNQIYNLFGKIHQ